MSACPFCGEEHDDGPVGEPGSWLEGVPILTCPKLPPDHVYFDQGFVVGPRGLLFSLDEMLRKAGEIPKGKP